MTKNIVDQIDEKVPVRNVLVSVSDKTGLEKIIPGLVDINPEIRFFSTGGTSARIAELLGEKAGKHLVQVSDYTGQPETQGGLVKTLDFKIYLGLLTETYNEAHQSDLARTDGVAIDMTIVNLYPFRETISKEDATMEMARGNVDIGGPCMIRASAKNFLRVAPIVDPADYDAVLAELEETGGATGLAMRYRLAGKAFAHTADYDRAIADYLSAANFDTDVNPCYRSGL